MPLVVAPHILLHFIAHTPPMQNAELVELAALAAFHGPTLVVGASGVSVAGLEDYWSASKCRFDRWAAALGRLRRGETPLFDGAPGDVRALVEEILGGEVLTRIWTAAVTLFDRRRSAQDNEIIVRSVHIGHQELRRRALQLLLGGSSLGSDDAVALNRLRHRAEQWTDMLLAPLALHGEVAEFAFDAGRHRAHVAELHDDAGGERAALLQTTVRTFSARAFRESAPCADLNLRIAAAVLGGFSPELFDSCGLIRSLWMMRLSKTADEAERMVDDLFRAERLPSAATLPPRRF